jgi:hypothetical protein
MHILFVDESGTPPKPGKTSPKYFVVGGVIIPEGAWHRLRDAVLGLKLRYGIRGEIKWRYFAPENEDAQNPMRALPHDRRNQIRAEMLRILTSEASVKAVACVCSPGAAYEMPSVNTPEDLYHGTYKPVTERFQYYLQDLSRSIGSKQYGIIVADHRGRQEDRRLRSHHQKLLHANAEHISTYSNLIEGLFLQPSNLSVGIQLADLAAGAIWRKYERGDSTWYDLLAPCIRTSASGVVDGHGIVKYPKGNWR